MGCSAEAKGMACIKGRALQHNAEQLALLDKQMVDRNIVYFVLTPLTYGFYQIEIFR
jgi:hypothetical protein